MEKSMQFGESVRKAMEMAYLTPDIVAARARVIEILKVQAGEKVLDIGSGPGLLVKELANCIGVDGSVCGIDLAENMISAGSKLCADQPWAKFQVGDAMSIPFSNASFDAVVSTQVYEYVSDLSRAVSEFNRVLRPGGRGVIVATDWAVPYWSATDTTVRESIIEAWSEHCAQENVPMRLSRIIRSTNLDVAGITACPLFNYTYDDNTFSYWVSKIIGDFVLGRKGIEQEDVDSWLEGLEYLGKKGEYFFCINRYIFEVRKSR